MKPLVVFLGAALLVGLLATPASAAQPSPTAACETDGLDEPHVVVTVPGIDRTFTDSVTLYAGSTATVVLCDGSEPVSPNDGETWSIAQSDAIADSSALSDGWRIEIAAVETTAEIPARIEGSPVETGATIETTMGATAESELEGVGVLRFADQAAAAEYATLEADYRNASLDVTERASSVEAVTEEISTEGIDAELHDAALTELQALNADYTDMRANVDATRQLLFDAVFARGLAPDQHLQALSATEAQHAATDRTVGEATEAHSTAVENEYRTAADALRGYMVPVFALGLFVGLLAGGGYVTQKGREYDHFRELDSSSSYGLSVLVWPVGIAVVLLAVCALLLYVSGGWHAYRGVIG